MRVFLIMAMILVPQGLRADEAYLARVMPELQRGSLDAWIFDPKRGLDRVIDIAFGYGSQNAMTPEAIDIAITHGHAEARARAIKDLLQADLDNDLAVTRAEVDAVDLHLSGYERGRLWTRHRKADENRDGTVSFEELRAYALVRADSYLGPGRADDLRALMHLDMNGDGLVPVEEAEEAFALLASEAVSAYLANDQDLDI